MSDELHRHTAEELTEFVAKLRHPDGTVVTLTTAQAAFAAGGVVMVPSRRPGKQFALDLAAACQIASGRPVRIIAQDEAAAEAARQRALDLVDRIS